MPSDAYWTEADELGMRGAFQVNRRPEPVYATVAEVRPGVHQVTAPSGVRAKELALAIDELTDADPSLCLVNWVDGGNETRLVFS